MPISLETFQQSLDTSKVQGFVKLSDNGTAVKSYGGGFFARHFGLYTKPSAAENNAVRRAFYESVMDTYHCQGEVLDTLRRELGIQEDGTSISGRQLSVREAKDILQRVKTAMAEERSVVKDIDNGKHFDIPLLRAFQGALASFFQSSLDLADRADTIPTVEKAFGSAFRDYNRVGTSLKIGDTFVSRVTDFTQDVFEARNANNQAMLAKLEHFFGQDPVNGQRAARVIGDLVHQGFMAGVMISIFSSKEPCDIQLEEDASHVMDFTLNRAEDGSYKLQYKGVYNYRMAIKDGRRVVFNPAESTVRFDIDMRISFDQQTGKPRITFDNPPTMSGKLTPLKGFGLTEVGAIQTYIDPTDGTSFKVFGTLTGEFAKPDILQATLHPTSKESTIELLRSRIITNSDLEILGLVGIKAGVVKEMIAGSAADDDAPRLGKEIIGRLLNPETRESAVRDLKTMAQPIADIGWIEQVPDIQPEAINLVTVAGLSTISYKYGQCDARLVCDYISQSADPGVKSLLADLQSDNPATVAAAKARVQDLAHTLRGQLGLKLVSSHLPGFSAAQVELIEKHVPKEQYQEALRHIVDKDSYFEDSIKVIESKLAGARILEKEEEDAEREADKTEKKTLE